MLNMKPDFFILLLFLLAAFFIADHMIRFFGEVIEQKVGVKPNFLKNPWRRSAFIVGLMLFIIIIPGSVLFLIGLYFLAEPIESYIDDYERKKEETGNSVKKQRWGIRSLAYLMLYILTALFQYSLFS